MNKIKKFGWRGDDRDLATVKKHGGFLPRYLMKRHIDGADGFIACQNKVDGEIGCKCNGFDKENLFKLARYEFLELMKKPGDLQSHVIARFGGITYVSTGTNPAEAFDREHKYEVSGFYYEYTIAEAAARFRTESKIRGLDKNMKVFIDSMNIGQAKLIAMVPPHSPNELTFITPVLAEYITEVTKAD